MKYILTAQLLNPFRSNKPRGFYNILKGHTGVDLNFHFEQLPAPVSGKIMFVTKQAEMGNCIYLDDVEMGNIHVFAHMDRIDVQSGDQVVRGQILGLTGNSGSKTTQPHLHYEIITFKRPDKKTPTPYDSLFSLVMTRSLNGLSGWNISPLEYLRVLYGKYRLDKYGNPIEKPPVVQEPEKPTYPPSKSPKSPR